ncbi:B2 protein [Glycine max]|nr:B2 protein [Glycine max]
MRTERRIQIFNISRIMHFSRKSVVSSVGRNLEKYQLDGVIFGCKKSTLQECQAKQLFASHFSYVKNSLPIFLFNYSDKKLHGIFEASSKGKMYIDPYAWIDDDLALERTQYPAHVSLPISTNQTLNSHVPVEDKFARVIVKNYYSNNHFLFELDHKQASKLSSLPASLAFASDCNLKWKTISPSLPSTLKEDEPCEKLKKLALGHLNQDLSLSDNVDDTPDEKNIILVCCGKKGSYGCQ